MSYVLFGCQLFLALIFLLAAAGKMLYPKQLLLALQVSKIAPPLRPLLAILLVVTEITLAMSLILQFPVPLESTLTGVLLVLAIFTSWLIWIRAQRISLHCGCFGQSKSDVGLGSVLRNLVFMTLAAFALVFSLRTASISFPLSLWALPISLTVSFGSVFLMTGHLYVLSKRQNQTQVRVA